MKNAAMMKKNAPRFVDDTHVLVTKEFAKNARIFGTPEYKVWKEIRLDCPTAEMVTKTIKKNPDKKTSTKNMTYENMAIYIREQDNAARVIENGLCRIEKNKSPVRMYVIVQGLKRAFELCYTTLELS